MISFLWWIIGFYWVVSGGEVLEHGAPRLYWYVIFSIYCKLEYLHLVNLNVALQGFNEGVISVIYSIPLSTLYTLYLCNKPLIGIWHISC
jgi:hypothetical protein